jgi:hypothetical protein
MTQLTELDVEKALGFIKRAQHLMHEGHPAMCATQAKENALLSIDAALSELSRIPQNPVKGDGWLPIEQAIGKYGKLIVTNNINARGNNGKLTHVWMVDMVHKNKAGDVGIEGLYYAIGGPYNLKYFFELESVLPTPPVGEPLDDGGKK